MGENFDQTLRGSFCRFGSLVVPAKIISDKSLTCTSPPSKIKVVPSDGLYKGGTPVAIYGANFFNSIFLTCSFGGKRGTSIVWISSSQINCVTPAWHKPGAVQVQISNNGVNFSTESVVFSYHGYVQVFSVFPSFGFPGTVIVVSGKNFLPDAKCKFGIWTSNATYISSGKVECTAPSDPPVSSIGHALEVQISNDGVDSSPPTHAGMFTYIKSPVIELAPRKLSPWVVNY